MTIAQEPKAGGALAHIAKTYPVWRPSYTHTWIRCILSSGWFDVLELFKSFGDVAWHGQVYLAAFVIPIYGDADVS